jgi:hypothetical protein
LLHILFLLPYYQGYNMEFITTIEDFSKIVGIHCIPKDTKIRVIIDNIETMSKNIELREISQEEQRRLLNLMPCEYDTEASEELITIIEKAHINTDTLHLE